MLGDRCASMLEHWINVHACFCGCFLTYVGLNNNLDIIANLSKAVGKVARGTKGMFKHLKHLKKTSVWNP